MELGAATAEIYFRHAFIQMLDVADRLGEMRVNERPFGAETNAVAALIIHCCELTEFWLGHVGLARPTHRDRESEFSRTASVPELHAAVETTMATIGLDLRRIEAGETVPSEIRQFLTGGDESDGSVVLHVLEEIYQHLGHMEITADALTSR